MVTPTLDELDNEPWSGYIKCSQSWVCSVNVTVTNGIAAPIHFIVKQWSLLTPTLVFVFIVMITKSRRYSQWNVSMTSPCSQHTTDSPEWYKIPCKSSSDLKRLINTPHTLSCSLLTTIFFFFWPQRKGLYLIIPIIMLVNNRCTGGNNVWVYQIKEMNRQCWFFTFLNR